MASGTAPSPRVDRSLNGYPATGVCPLEGWERMNEDSSLDTFTSDDNPRPSPLAMGDDDMCSVIYLNLEEKIPTEHKERLKELETAIRSSNKWLAVKTGVLTEEKLQQKKLPDGDSIDDELKRAAYRAMVAEYYLSTNVPWLVPIDQGTRKIAIDCRKPDLHNKLLQFVTEGIAKPGWIHPIADSIYKKMADEIVSRPNRRGVYQMYTILLAVYKYDEELNTVVPRIRMIFYNASQEIHEYAAHKAVFQYANFTLHYCWRDFHFEEGIWNAMENDIMAYLFKQDIRLLRGTTDSPLDRKSARH